MPDRSKKLVSTLRLTCSLALLAAAAVATPGRTSGFATGSVRPPCLRRNFALPPDQSTTRLDAATATDAVPRVSALPSENEEQDWDDALDEPRASFPAPGSFRKIFDPRLVASRTILFLYPLRC